MKKKIFTILLLCLIAFSGITLMSCKPDDNVIPKPNIETKFNVKSFNELKSLVPNSGDSTSDEYYVSGYIKEISNETTGNMVLENTTGDTLSIASLDDINGKINFVNLTDKPKLEDAIVVIGKMVNVNGKVQMASCKLVQLNQTVYEKEIEVDVEEVLVAIKGKSEIKYTDEENFKAYIDGEASNEVTWEIREGNEYCSISTEGVFKPSKVDGDKIVEIIARSKVNPDCYASKVVVILAQPTLTQSMLDELMVEKIGFEGYLSISLSEIGISNKPVASYTSAVKTAMDGDNWYAEYTNGDTGTVMGLYIKNRDNFANSVGVNFANTEIYEPMLDDDGNKVTWLDSGLYNNFKGLKVEDFEFDTDTWRWKYIGKDASLTTKLVASANPYEFTPDPTVPFQLIVEDGEILGFYAKSLPDYNISQPYEAILELFVAVAIGDTVEVKTISKYEHADFHNELQSAIDYMQNLTNYKLECVTTVASYLTTGYVTSGFTEIITNNNCYFQDFDLSYDEYGNLQKNYDGSSIYGYKKIEELLYNAYRIDTETNKFVASRAYETEFKNAMPSFAFAAEIFTAYAIDEEEGTTVYYIDDSMTSAASCLYYGVGNDINLYGIFATRGYLSQSQSFTPFVTVKDGKIISACFYFYMGSMYGLVELTYDEFNEASLPEEVDFDFEKRLVPTSWDELTFIKSNDSTTTEEDEFVNAKEFFIEYFAQTSNMTKEELESVLPFFGDALGDTYGFGLLTGRIPNGSSINYQCLTFYYDVPLDVDYTIDSSLEKIDEYLIGLGFTEKDGEYSKSINGKTIYVAPVDSSLDLMIYMWGDNYYVQGE